MLSLYHYRDVLVNVIIANGWHYFHLKEYVVRESSLFEQKAVNSLHDKVNFASR